MQWGGPASGCCVYTATFICMYARTGRRQRDSNGISTSAAARPRPLHALRGGDLRMHILRLVLPAARLLGKGSIAMCGLWAMCSNRGTLHILPFLIGPETCTWPGQRGQGFPALARWWLRGVGAPVEGGWCGAGVGQQDLGIWVGVSCSLVMA